MAKWKVTSNRFVAFLDIMGFQNLVFRNTHKHVLALMEEIYHSLSIFENEYKSRKGACVRPVLFSDSILLISNDNSEDSLEEIVFNTEWVLGSAFKRGLPMKGAIALGQQTADFSRSLHFGRPLIDAYNLQNELSFYGVVLHDSVEKKHDTAAFKSALLRRYKTPLKNGQVNHWVLDWRRIVMPKKESKNVYAAVLQSEKNYPLAVLENIYKTVSGAARSYVDNTIEYIKWIDEMHPIKK